MIRNLIQRYMTFALKFLVSVDQLIQTIIVGIWWLFTNIGDAPDPDETISGVLGRAVHRNQKWAILPAVLIDALFLIITLGKERDHCDRVYLSELKRKGS